MADVRNAFVPWRGMPKKRPRVTANGTYMPKAYQEWKENVAEYLGHMMLHVEGQVHLHLVFHRKGIELEVHEVIDPLDRWGSADLDNLVGAVMDALQDSGVIDNDRQVVSVTASFPEQE